MLAPGQAPIRAAWLTQTGMLRASLRSGRWMPFRATQHIEPPAVSFNWDAKVYIAPFFHLRVRDAFHEGRGSARVELLSMIKLAGDAGSAELNAGALVRYLAEAVWYPTALLPSEHLDWSAIDDRKARATLTSHGTTVSLEFHFNDKGEVAAIYTPQRWFREGGKYRQMPWEGHFFSYTESSGMRAPSSGEVGWYVDGRWEAVWKGRITSARYEFGAS